ncbi:reverse transcriptase domain, reverse transcriptase zinc-binding domain protein [Tanacetum coccineum]
MESVLENGPWLIRLVPLFLNIWTPNTILKKEEIREAPVWIKLHHVPIVAYSEVRLSLITTQIGKPIMLDSYTSSMCLKSWGEKEYVRALIEVSSETELIEILRESTKVIKKDDEGFTVVKKKKNKSKNAQVDGIRLTKPSLNLHYKRVDKGESSKTQQTSNTSRATDTIQNKDETDLINPSSTTVQSSLKYVPKPNKTSVDLKNPFSSLSDEDASAWGDEAT